MRIYFIGKFYKNRKNICIFRKKDVFLRSIFEFNRIKNKKQSQNDVKIRKRWEIYDLMHCVRRWHIRPLPWRQ